MKIKIFITKEVLKRSMYCKGEISKSCGVAVAVRDLFSNASVGADTMGFGCNADPCAVADLPYEARSFICNFDSSTPEQRLNLPEFSFEIDVPDSVIETIGIEEAKSIIERSETLELVEG